MVSSLWRVEWTSILQAARTNARRRRSFQTKRQVGTTANARSVYGEPVHAYERTIVPVATFGYGLRATSGGRDGENVGGGAGVGGVGARPAGYIEISSAGRGMWSISTFRNVVIAALAGITAGLLWDACAVRPYRFVFGPNSVLGGAIQAPTPEEMALYDESLCLVV